MDVKDFSRCGLSKRYYSGSEKKLGIVIDDVEYMLKFQKKTPFGVRNNHISEYIGSHIFEMLGFETQETYLGVYKGEQVVACRDFNVDGKQFVPFNDVGESTLEYDKEVYQYEYEDIMKMLRDNSKLTNVDDTINMFWEIYIVDALLGNFDRHGANWGFIKSENRYVMAPVFDNGSALFPNMTDEDELINIIESEEETGKRIYSFPTSQVKLKGKKSSYYEVINSICFEECNRALQKVYKRIDFNKIEKFINDTPLISPTQKKFYIHMLRARYEHILKGAYEKLEKR